MTYPSDVARAVQIVDQIGALVVLNDHVTQSQGEQIARMFGGDYTLFEFLDEQPGDWLLNAGGAGTGRYLDSQGREWHWKLRQARNGCDRFFDLLAQPDPDPVAA